MLTDADANKAAAKLGRTPQTNLRDPKEERQRRRIQGSWAVSFKVDCQYPLLSENHNILALFHYPPGDELPTDPNAVRQGTTFSAFSLFPI